MNKKTVELNDFEKTISEIKNKYIYENGKTEYLILENKEYFNISCELFWAINKSLKNTRFKNLKKLLCLLGCDITKTEEIEKFLKLCTIENFHKFYTMVYECYYNNADETTTEIIYKGLEELREFTDINLNYLIQQFLEKFCEYARGKHCTEKCSEKTYQENIIKNFNKFFPEYSYLSQYNKVEGVGNLDILAIDKVSGRYVVLELKTGKANPNKQLFAYSHIYENPIMVAVTTKEVMSKNEKIIFKVIPFKESF